MKRELPDILLSFLKDGIKDMEDGYEYASEFNRILNSDDCQRILTGRELDALRDYADEVRKVGEINHYTQEKIKEIEREHFGSRGIKGYLHLEEATEQTFVWPFNKS